MYKKIYEYIVSIDLKEREDYFRKMENFTRNYENGFESFKEIGEELKSLLEENKKFEELEIMEDFLWDKVYNIKRVSDK